MIALMPQTCFWNAVDRAVVILGGAESFAISGMLVCDGRHATAVLPVSLNVICFQRVPPHWGPGDCTWARAGAANAATQAASAAVVVRTKRILGPPSGIEEAAANSTMDRPSDGRPTRPKELPLSRELDAQDAEQHDETDPRDPEREHEPRAPRFAQLLNRDLSPENDEPRRRGEADHDDRCEIDRPLGGPTHNPRREEHEARHDRERDPEAVSTHGPRGTLRPWRERGTTTPATIMSSSSSATASASTRTTSSSG